MVRFNDLWYGHPINQSVQTPCISPKDGPHYGGTVRKGYPTFSNQCAIRMGVSLKRAGVEPGQISGATCGVHSSSEMHFIRAAELGSAIAGASIDWHRVH